MDLIMLLKDYQTLITGIVATVVIVVGLAFTNRQLDYMKKDRHSELAMRLWSLWNSNMVNESRKCLLDIEKESMCEKLEEYKKSDSEKFFILIRVGNFYEHIGMLVSKEYIEDPELIIDTFGPSIKHYYEFYNEYILKERKNGNPELFIHFEKLLERVPQEQHESD